MEEVSLEKSESKVEKLLLQEIRNTSSYLKGSGYRLMCKLAVEHDDVFKVFKRSKYYTALGHERQEHGQMYLDIIKKTAEGLLEYFPTFQESDTIGNPIVFPYSVGQFSPTTLKYIKVLADLRNFFGGLNKLDIVEIGGGYGGQCKITSDVYVPNLYTIIDLDVAVPLIKKCLEALNVEHCCVLTQDQISSDKKYDLVISNCAFSEVSKNLQRCYIDKILASAQRGYITYNRVGSRIAVTYSRKEIIKLLSEHHAVCIIDEGPWGTIHGSVNFIIAWDDSRPNELQKVTTWYSENREKLGWIIL